MAWWLVITNYDLVVLHYIYHYCVIFCLPSYQCNMYLIVSRCDIAIWYVWCTDCTAGCTEERAKPRVDYYTTIPVQPASQLGRQSAADRHWLADWSSSITKTGPDIWSCLVRGGLLPPVISRPMWEHNNTMTDCLCYQGSRVRLRPRLALSCVTCQSVVAGSPV